MRDEIQRLRATLNRLPHGLRRRFPASVRAEIVRLGQRLRKEGKSWHDSAAVLGINVQSLRRYCQRQEGTGFVPVEISGADHAGDATAVLVSPQGYCVEGLTLAAVAELLERLR